MNTGKTLFAQIKDLLPWKTFHRIVARHGGDKGVRTLTCAEKFRTMAFAQLTNRQSLRDFEACMQAQAPKKPSSPRIHRRKAAIDIPIPESGQSPQAGECPERTDDVFMGYGCLLFFKLTFLGQIGGHLCPFACS